MASSPLSSLSMFSAYEAGSRPSTPPKSPAPKKRGRKKKETEKPKTSKKGRKQTIATSSPEPHHIEKPPALDECSPPNLHGKSTNPTYSASHGHALDDHPTRVEQSEQHDRTKDESSKQSKTRFSPRKTTQTNEDSPKDMTTTRYEEADPTPFPTESVGLNAPRPASPTPTDEHHSKRGTGSENKREKSYNSKNDSKQKRPKKSSLAEILALTNPKTKRGIQVGLPREKKHRLHININPNPVVQKQVKKKLKLKRGEYDSGEDDPQVKNNSSDEDDGDSEGHRQFKTKFSCNPNSLEDVDEDNGDEDFDEGEDN